jgi:hypothetical protein
LPGAEKGTTFSDADRGMVASTENLLHPLRGFLVGSSNKWPYRSIVSLIDACPRRSAIFLRVHSLGNQEGLMGVPQVVEPHLREPSFGEDLLEPCKRLVVSTGGSNSGLEDKLLFLPGGIR